MCVCVWMGWGAVFSRKRKRALNNRSRERERAERCGSYRISSVGAGSAGSSFERPRTEADYRTHPFPQHRPPGVEKDRQRERERERERDGEARRFWFRVVSLSTVAFGFEKSLRPFSRPRRPSLASSCVFAAARRWFRFVFFRAHRLSK